MPLRVQVNDELVLDAGRCEEVSGPQGPERILHPPKTTLFHQVLAYFKAKPEPPKRPFGPMAGREGVAAAALTLRWGSYLAVNPGGIVHAPWLDLPLEIEGQLLAKEEILGCEAAVGRTG